MSTGREGGREGEGAAARSFGKLMQSSCMKIVKLFGQISFRWGRLRAAEESVLGSRPEGLSFSTGSFAARLPLRNWGSGGGSANIIMDHSNGAPRHDGMGGPKRQKQGRKEGGSGAGNRL